MRKKWILLAENDARYADQALRMLTAGYEPPEVVVARDGSEVLDYLYHRNGFQTHPAGNPAVVLLDLNMPKVNGWEVLRQIKNDATLRTIPIVVFASSTEASDCYRSYQLGANAYVVKPANFRRLAAALERVMEFWITVNELPPEAPNNSIQSRHNWASPLDQTTPIGLDERPRPDKRQNGHASPVTPRLDGIELRSFARGR